MKVDCAKLMCTAYCLLHVIKFSLLCGVVFVTATAGCVLFVLLQALVHVSTCACATCQISS